MYHQGNLFSNFSAWWDRHDIKYTDLGINESEFHDFILKNGFNKGDILFIIHANPKKLKVGDIIIFNAGQTNPVIHRIIAIRETSQGRIFSTIGDNNNGQLSFENGITENMILGKASIKIAPYLGWIKLIFYDWRKPAIERGLCHEN